MTEPAVISSHDVSQPALTGKRRWLLVGICLLGLAGGGFLLWRFLGARNTPPAGLQLGPVPVTLARLQTRTIREQVEFVGMLDSQSGVALQSEAAGRITRIYVASGDQVSAGQPIMELSADRSQAELNAALASVSAARSARDNAQAQVRSLRAQQIRLEAELELQNIEYERAQRLVSQGALPQQQLDEINRDRNAARASLQAAIQEIAAAQANVNQADAFLTQSQATATATQEDLQDKTVTAPIAGTVGDITVELGDYVQPGMPLTTITQNENLELEIAVPTEAANQILLGMPVELLPFDSDSAIAEGAISFIGLETDPETQTVLAKARFENNAQRLQDNQRVNVRITLGERPGLLVPVTAVTRLGGQTFVYVSAAPPPPSETEPAPAAPSEPTTPSPQRVAQLRPVTLGDIQGNDYQVLKGLQAGDTIITSGLLNLQDGTPIQPQSDTTSEL